MQDEHLPTLLECTEWLIAGHNDSILLLEELAALPVPEWDAWLAAHPDARNVRVFQGLVQAAEEAEPEEALAVTEFVVRYVDSITAPPEGEIALASMRWDAWKARAQALRSAGDSAGASEAQERADALYRTEVSCASALIRR